MVAARHWRSSLLVSKREKKIASRATESPRQKDSGSVLLNSFMIAFFFFFHFLFAFSSCISLIHFWPSLLVYCSSRRSLVSNGGLLSFSRFPLFATGRFLHFSPFHFNRIWFILDTRTEQGRYLSAQGSYLCSPTLCCADGSNDQRWQGCSRCSQCLSVDDHCSVKLHRLLLIQLQLHPGSLDVAASCRWSRSHGIWYLPLPLWFPLPSIHSLTYWIHWRR